MDYSEKWGGSIEEAVNEALKVLKLSRDEVDVTVLEEPSRGFFGIGSKLAKVRVEKKKPPVEEVPGTCASGPDAAGEPGSCDDAETPHEDAGERTDRETKRQKGHRSRRSNVYLGDKNIESLEDVEEHEALDFLKDISEKMGLSLTFNVKVGEDIVYLEMHGEDSRTIIGKRGQTLDAVQYLTSLVVNRDSDRYVKVVVDAENYRSKRQRTLEQLANRLASKVVRTGKYIRLEPMNPYERKIIHTALQNHPDINTRSEGDEPYRRVVIELKR